jgi:hypothetical protein
MAHGKLFEFPPAIRRSTPPAFTEHAKRPLKDMLGQLVRHFFRHLTAVDNVPFHEGGMLRLILATDAYEISIQAALLTEAAVDNRPRPL